MNNKINERIGYYNKMLNRKENLVKPLHAKQSVFTELTDNEYTKMLILESEIKMINEVIEDMKYLLVEVE